MQNQQLNSTSQNIFHTDAVKSLRLSPYVDYLAVVIDKTLSIFHLKKSLNYSILLSDEVSNMQFLSNYLAIRFTNGSVRIFQIREHQSLEIQIYQNPKERSRILHSNPRFLTILYESSIVSYSDTMIKTTTNIDNTNEQYCHMATVSDQIYLATKQKLYYLQAKTLKPVQIKSQPITIIGTINYLIVILKQGYCQLVSHGASKGLSPILLQLANPVVQLKPQLFKYTCNQQSRESLWMNCGNCLTEIEVGPIQNYNTFFNFVYYVKRIVLQQLMVDYDVTYTEPNLIMFRNHTGLKKLNVMMEQLPHPEDFKKQDVKAKEYPKPKRIKQKQSKESKTLKRPNEPPVMNREQPIKNEPVRSGSTGRKEQTKHNPFLSEQSKKTENANEKQPDKEQQKSQVQQQPQTQQPQAPSPPAPPTTPADLPNDPPTGIPQVSSFQAKQTDQITHKVVEALLEDQDGDTFSQGQDIRQFTNHLHSQIQSTIRFFDSTLTQTMTAHTKNMKKQLKSMSQQFINNSTLQALQATKNTISTYIKGQFNTKMENYFKQLFKQTWENQQSGINYLNEVRKKEKQKQQIVNNDMLQNNIKKIQNLLESLKNNTKEEGEAKIDGLMARLSDLTDRMNKLVDQQQQQVEDNAQRNGQILQKLEKISQLIQGARGEQKKKYLIIRKAANN